MTLTQKRKLGHVMSRCCTATCGPTPAPSSRLVVHDPRSTARLLGVGEWAESDLGLIALVVLVLEDIKGIALCSRVVRSTSFHWREGVTILILMKT